MPDGKTVPMTDAFREGIIAKYATMAVRPLRCLALAIKVTRGNVLVVQPFLGRLSPLISSRELLLLLLLLLSIPHSPINQTPLFG